MLSEFSADSVAEMDLHKTIWREDVRNKIYWLQMENKKYVALKKLIFFLQMIIVLSMSKAMAKKVDYRWILRKNIK